MPLRWRISGVAACMLVSLAAPPALSRACYEQEVLASDPRELHFFGRTVSLSGDVAILGALGDESHAFHNGAAYIFRHDGTEWVEEAKLLPDDLAEGDEFSTAVSIDGDLAVIGAPFHRAAGAPAGHVGAVYVYRHDGLDWSLDAKLTPTTPDNPWNFGVSVAVSGERLLVGSSSERPNSVLEAGAAYAFRYDGAAWVQEARLLPTVLERYSGFGFSCSLSGDVALIGGSSWHNNGPGTAHVFRLSGGTWVEEASLAPADSLPRERYGFAVSISGDAALVGASQDDDLNTNSGAVHFYRYSGGVWREEAKLYGRSEFCCERFGQSVSIDGHQALVGALDTQLGRDRSGSAYLFRFDGQTWTNELILTPRERVTGDDLGFAAALSDDWALVGAYGDSSLEWNNGAAYFFGPGELAIPEISPPGLDEQTGAFLVVKDGGDVRLRWEDTPHDVGIHVGTLAALWGPVGYDHAATSACRLTGTEYVYGSASPRNSYLLVIGSGCEGPSAEGPAGRDSRGASRPTASNLGHDTCP